MQFVDELPQKTGRAGRPSERGEALKDRPGQWAVFATYKSSATAHAAASRMRSGRLKWAPAGALEAEVRGLTVYVRWVGEQ